LLVLRSILNRFVAAMSREAASKRQRRIFGRWGEEVAREFEKRKGKQAIPGRRKSLLLTLWWHRGERRAPGVEEVEEEVEGDSKLSACKSTGIRAS
jgi:hypothetical protein